MKKVLFQLALLMAAMAASVPCGAALRLPYRPDAQTLHLWHFDDPANAPTIADAVASNAIPLTVSGTPAGSATNAALGVPSFSGLGNSLQILDKNAFAKGGVFTNTASFANPETGAFTFEAIVKFDVNPLGSSNNMQIICGDSNSALTNRGWQFRINTKGEMEFNILSGSDSDNCKKAPLPNSGPDAAVPGKWYHIAVTCTGDNPAGHTPANILIFYWTLLDKNRTRASQLAQFFLTRPLNGDPIGKTLPSLGIGGNCRLVNGPANSEGLIGAIDEVRISNVARQPNEMAFH